jgi:O-acetyl-ADP-ribose deacetylase (regulator of RNase III)
MEIVRGNILDAKEKYIVQQCNCLTVKSHGLSKTLAQHYDWGDIYATRRAIKGRNCAISTDRAVPGTISILESPEQDKAIICMFAQWTPGKPGVYKSYPEYAKDTYANRERWFKKCLEEMKKLNTEVIAFPWRIGCGLAGGNWSIYKKLLEEFSKESGIKCVLYKLE